MRGLATHLALQISNAYAGQIMYVTIDLRRRRGTRNNALVRKEWSIDGKTGEN